MPNDVLTEKQQLFVTNYMKSGKVVQSALKAGYSKSFAEDKAYTIMNNPIVKDRIAQSVVKVNDRLGMTFDWKLKKLKRIIDEYIPDDTMIDLTQSNVKIGLQAMTELNKMTGDYAPDKKLSVTVDATKDKLIEAKKAYDDY